MRRSARPLSPVEALTENRCATGRHSGYRRTRPGANAAASPVEPMSSEFHFRERQCSRSSSFSTVVRRPSKTTSRSPAGLHAVRLPARRSAMAGFAVEGRDLTRRLRAGLSMSLRREVHVEGLWRPWLCGGERAQRLAALQVLLRLDPGPLERVPVAPEVARRTCTVVRGSSVHSTPWTSPAWPRREVALASMVTSDTLLGSSCVLHFTSDS